MADNEDTDLDQTIDVSSGKRAPAEKPAPAPSDSNGEDFDMNWLEEGAEEDDDQDTAAPRAQTPDEQSDLTVHFEREEDVPKPAANPPEKPAAAKAKPAGPPPKKPTPKPAAADEDDIAEFAPAEGKQAEGEGGDDMDDFFRSLSEP